MTKQATAPSTAGATGGKGKQKIDFVRKKRKSYGKFEENKLENEWKMDKLKK